MSRRWRTPLAALSVGGLALLPAVSPAQTVRPPVRATPTERAIQGIEKSAREPVPSVERPTTPPGTSNVWVPDRYVQMPGVEGEVWVPGHWERKLSEHEYYVPPLMGRTRGGGVVNLPAGTQPPVEERQGP